MSPKQPTDPESAENCAKYVPGVSLFLEFTAARGAGGRVPREVSGRMNRVHPRGKTWALPWGGVSPRVGAAGFTGARAGGRREDRAQQAGGPQRRRLVLERADVPWLLRSGLMGRLVLFENQDPDRNSSGSPRPCRTSVPQGPPLPPSRH